MNRTVSFRTTAATVAAGLALSLATFALAAPPGPGHGPHMMGAAAGPGMRGDAAGGMLPQILQATKDKLALDTSQQLLWDQAIAQSKAMHEQGFARRQSLRGALDAELAKSEPDFAALASAADAIEDQGRAARHQARDQWLRLYQTFRPEQKAVVRDALKERISKFEAFRDQMHQRMQSRPAT